MGVVVLIYETRAVVVMLIVMVVMVVVRSSGLGQKSCSSNVGRDGGDGCGRSNGFGQKSCSSNVSNDCGCNSSGLRNKSNGFYHLQQCILMHFIIVEIASMYLDLIMIY